MSHPCADNITVFDLILDHKADSYTHRAAVKVAREICETCPLTGAAGPCAQTLWDDPSFAGGLTWEERQRITQPRGRLVRPKPLCAMLMCENEALARGLCPAHYRRERRREGKGEAA